MSLQKDARDERAAFITQAAPDIHRKVLDQLIYSISSAAYSGQGACFPRTEGFNCGGKCKRRRNRGILHSARLACSSPHGKIFRLYVILKNGEIFLVERTVVAALAFLEVTPALPSSVRAEILKYRDRNLPKAA
jgi:hypothetical protein